MSAMALKRDASAAKRQRTMLTPEGIALPVMLASRGARAGALLLDLALLFTIMIAALIIASIFFGGLGFLETPPPAIEFLLVVAILFFFLLRYGYFLFFELGPRGATPGKRALGIRVAARGGRTGGKLTAEAVLARNLMRDAEVFLPTTFLLGGGASEGAMGGATFVWLAVFVLFPFFNRDNLRAGDLVAGTWVVEAPRAKLEEALSLRIDAEAQPELHNYRFGEAELSIYGEHELQVLERVLREDRPEALREVMEAICRKLGWEAGSGDERAFLEAFYAALRAHLEQGMRFGKRKADKFA
ncbi:RDD family protein [Paraurantiacibacter namhicola]|uniref:RDD family protein n=1 Tax=Paraurantiacibacter namhicola TaxID=645517 RepID=A0A1C7DBG6_9SPHN|nr:RDD family protein [Paraurantiacibacter namhicola]ANU08798.1 RDD family protein [Paraurantiacibacter namhicola]